MKKLIYISFIFICFHSNAQSVFGKWKTIDDKTGEAKSIVEIFENSEKVYGKVVEIMDASKSSRKCDKCTGTDKDKPVLGLVIIKGLSKDGDEYNGGKIVDPESGKIYKSFIKLQGKDKLEVRGYIGFAIIGRSQTWIRVK
ncbi:DUF2147 domain-containing protein [Flavobacterium sp.]|uniref:DUF2147 domain-containing protein n=1 Tax=Flavobacterium sp. TaxID=239 RepID=UPI00286B2FCD|nr:DUF2147 domain-containing protein [Flavobacterium sp.]